jgi:hypothetical protein
MSPIIQLLMAGNANARVKDKMNTKKCSHGLDVDLVTGEDIIPRNVAMTMNEAVKLYKNQPPIFVHRAPTDKEKELQARIKKWDEYFQDNKGDGRINWWPKTFFDKHE